MLLLLLQIGFSWVRSTTGKQSIFQKQHSLLLASLILAHLLIVIILLIIYGYVLIIVYEGPAGVQTARFLLR